MRPDKCNIIFSTEAVIGEGKYLFAAAMASPYSRHRRDVARWVQRLVDRGSIVLYSYSDNEGQEIVGCYDRRRYPAASTTKLIKFVQEVNAAALTKQTLWELQHRKLAV